MRGFAERGEKKRGHQAAVTVRHVRNVNPKQRMRRTDKYCSFPEMMCPLLLLHPRPPHPKNQAHIYIYIYTSVVYGGFPKRAVMTPIPNDVSVSGNTVGGGGEGWGGAAGEEKGSNDPVTSDTVLQMQNGYSSRNLTKRGRL